MRISLHHSCFKLLLSLGMCSLFIDPASSQRDPSVHVGQAWESIEWQRYEIEDTLRMGDIAAGFVLSTSHLFQWKDTPAFQDITTSVYRGYGGLPLEEEETILTFFQTELAAKPFGLGWLECGLLAMAAMRPTDAVPAFQAASRDPLCRSVPMVHALLAEALYHTGDLHGATCAYEAAVKSASKSQAVLFQMRHLYAEALLKRGRIEEWQQMIQTCSDSSYPLESAYGLYQEAAYAWYRKDLDSCAPFVDLALAQTAIYGASPEWKWLWDKDRWDWVTRRLESARAALAGDPDGKLAMDYDAAVLDMHQGNQKGALARLEPLLAQYNLTEIDSWPTDRQLWVQRSHKAYYMLLGKMGRHEESIEGLKSMIPLARDNYHEKFEASLFCDLAYAYEMAQRNEEAREAYEIGLSLLDVPGEIIDPNVAYHPRGRIGKRARVADVANYRYLLSH